MIGHRQECLCTVSTPSSCDRAQARVPVLLEGKSRRMLWKATMIRSKIALRFLRALPMPFLWALLTLALHLSPSIVAPIHAQGSRKDDIVFNSRGVPLAGAAVRVCAMPASGQPCAPLALL